MYPYNTNEVFFSKREAEEENEENNEKYVCIDDASEREKKNKSKECVIRYKKAAKMNEIFFMIQRQSNGETNQTCKSDLYEQKKKRIKKETFAIMLLEKKENIFFLLSILLKNINHNVLQICLMVEKKNDVRMRFKTENQKKKKLIDQKKWMNVKEKKIASHSVL